MRLRGAVPFSRKNLGRHLVLAVVLTETSHLFVPQFPNL